MCVCVCVCVCVCTGGSGAVSKMFSPPREAVDAERVNEAEVQCTVVLPHERTESIVEL